MVQILENLNNYLNLDSLKQNKVTIISALLIFYTAAPASGDHLLASQLRDVINDNRFAQHSIGFLKMFISMILVGNITDTRTAIVFAMCAYSWFILTTKLDLEWNFFILFLLLLGFLYEHQTCTREDESNIDEVLSEEDRQKLKDKHKKYKMYILIGIGILTIIGTFVYANKKQLQYGNDFNIKDFFYSDRNKK